MAILSHSAIARTTNRPSKPYPEFPLSPHARGRWVKRINGKHYYFGSWDDWEAALREYEEQLPYIKAGKSPPPKPEGLCLADLCNQFLEFKNSAVESGELAKRSFEDYRSTCKRLVAILGKKHRVVDLAPVDFQRVRAELAKTKGPTTLGSEINRIRVTFKWAYDQELIERPMRYGQGFKRPSKKTQRLHKAERAKDGTATFAPEEVHTLIGIAAPAMRAMIWLAINTGCGNNDIGQLESCHVDLDGGWLDFPRPKTGIERRAKLWPETCDALRAAIKVRPEAKTDVHRDLVFRTKRGGSWSKDSSDNPVCKEFRKLLNRTGLYAPRRGFYALRHTAATAGRRVGDDEALKHMMGHEAGDMLSDHYTHRFPDERMLSGHYTHRFPDERLIAVSDCIRAWLGAADHA